MTNQSYDQNFLEKFATHGYIKKDIKWERLFTWIPLDLLDGVYSTTLFWPTTNSIYDQVCRTYPLCQFGSTVLYRTGHEKVARFPFCTCPCYCINFCIYAMLQTRSTFSWPSLTHHQELSTVHSAIGTFHAGYVIASKQSQVGTALHPDSSRIRSHNLHKT